MKVCVVGANSTLCKGFMDYTKETFDFIRIGRNSEFDICCDLRESIDAITINGCDTLVYFAALYNDKNGDYREILDMIQVNVVGLINMIEMAAKSGVRHVVYVSTIYVENQQQKFGQTYYGYTKYFAEKIASLYCKQNGIDLAIVRPAQIVGVGMGNKNSQPLFYSFLEKIRTNQDVVIYGEIDPIRPYLYEDNLYEVLKEIIFKREKGVLRIVPQERMHLSEIAMMICEEYGSISKVMFDRSKPDIEELEIEERVAGTRNAFEVFDIEYTSLAEGIKKICNMNR